MSYLLVIRPRVRRHITLCGLSDTMIVEVYQRLRDLQDKPAASLLRVRTPFDGMGRFVDVVDPANRICVHRFLFHVLYSQDEEQLIVMQAFYERTVG